MHQYHLTLLGMCEVSWNFFGEIKLETGKTLLYSGKGNEEDQHEAGVALLKGTARSLMEWEPVSDRIITARFEYGFQQVSIIMCYASTNNAQENTKELLYSQLQTVVDRIPRTDMLILMGDMNAKVGKQQTENLMDHIVVRQWWRSSLQDVRTKRGADSGSNHYLVIAKLKVHPRSL
uniref:Endonuclease/exonuclease/phosphatase domain-containing protein n=1 Tax=Octopus bimaculoides TaxID=37653 RepID=A0A0L8I5N8_OCTBM